MSDERSTEIGTRIAQARKEAGGMSQVELAGLIGVSERSLQLYEAGETIPYRWMKDLERVLQRPVAWFLHGDAGMVVRGEERAKLEELEGLVKQVLAELHQLREEVRRGQR